MQQHGGLGLARATWQPILQSSYQITLKVWMLLLPLPLLMLLMPLNASLPLLPTCDCLRPVMQLLTRMPAWRLLHAQPCRAGLGGKT